mgnify:CR=1 FL=1
MKQAFAGGYPEPNMPAYQKTIIMQSPSWQSQLVTVIQDKFGTFGISLILGIAIGLVIVFKMRKK